MGAVAPQLCHSLQGCCSVLLAGDALKHRQQAPLVCRQERANFRAVMEAACGY